MWPHPTWGRRGAADWRACCGRSQRQRGTPVEEIRAGKRRRINGRRGVRGSEIELQNENSSAEGASSGWDNDKSSLRAAPRWAVVDEAKIFSPVASSVQRHAVNLDPPRSLRVSILKRSNLQRAPPGDSAVSHLLICPPPHPLLPLPSSETICFYLASRLFFQTVSSRRPSVHFPLSTSLSLAALVLSRPHISLTLCPHISFWLRLSLGSLVHSPPLIFFCLFTRFFPLPYSVYLYCRTPPVLLSPRAALLSSTSPTLLSCFTPRFSRCIKSVSSAWKPHRPAEFWGGGAGDGES